MTLKTSSTEVIMIAEDQGLCEKLLVKEGDKVQEKLLENCKSYSGFIGLWCGVYVQLSTLGANFLLVAMWGEDAKTRSQSDAMVFSLGWSFFTSCMALVILALLRNMVATILNATSYQEEQSRESKFHTGWEP